MNKCYDLETNKYFGIEEGMRIKSWRGLDTEVFFTVEQWDKSRPVLTDDGEFFQYLQIRDDEGQTYWIRSYPSWVVL